jgi:hypothetical protein
MKTMEAEGIVAPISPNGVTKLEDYFSPGEARRRLLGVSIEHGKVKGATEVKLVGNSLEGELIEYHMMQTGNGKDIAKTLKKLAGEPVPKIAEEVSSMTWTHDEKWKRDNSWDVLLYFTKKGDFEGMTVYLPAPADPRTPFEYKVGRDDRKTLDAFLNQEEVKKVLSYKPDPRDILLMKEFVKNEQVKRTLEL